MMKDEDFTSTATVDRYGRKVPKTQGRKKLERLYEVADEDDEEDEDEDKEDVDVDVDDDDDVQRELARIEKKFDPVRQGGFEESSSEEESSSDEEEEDVEDMVGGEDGEDDDAVEMGEVSRRLAIVNLDWDNIRATDLMAAASSFAPPEGRILDVTIFPSEYGKERMEREEQEGPDPKLFANSRNARQSTLIDGDISDASDSDSDIDEDEKIKKSLIAKATAGEPEIDSRALRAYQLSRLRYYYAVVTCDSENTASALYKDMDGREYLSTSNFFDMRFVPDEVDFDDDKPRDTCTKVPDGYKPNEFVTEALTHSKVRLTWDEEDTNRKEVQKRAFSRQEVDENDLKAYIGSDSSDDEDEEEDGGVEVVDGTTGDSTKAAPKLSKAEAARAKMRAALGLAEDKTKTRRPKADVEKSVPTGGMQITFTAGLSSTSMKPTTDDTTTDSTVFKNRPEDVQEETTLERYKRKEKERKARRKAKNKGGEDDEDVVAPAEEEVMVDGDGENQEDDPFNDPFFTDPAAANAAAKKAAKKAKRDAAAAEVAAAANAKQKEKAELELLMAGDVVDGTSLGERSFSMAAIRKAEKDARKGTKGKKKKAKKGWKGESLEDNGEQVDDGFVMNVQDDRFKEAFENHDFAIDPSNPKFVETEGMKKLLQEGRKRRENVIGEEVVSGKRKADRRGNGEVDDLVEKIKRRKANIRS